MTKAQELTELAQRMPLLIVDVIAASVRRRGMLEMLAKHAGVSDSDAPRFSDEELTLCLLEKLRGSC